jgi:hypothetical protein
MKAISLTNSKGTAAKSAMSSMRKTSLAAGILYLLTFVSVPTLSLYAPVHNGTYFTGNENDTRVIIGGLLEIIVGITCIGTALVLYPVLKRQNKRMALGLVAFRVLEAGTIFIGVAFLLTAVTMHQQGTGNLATYQTLVTLYNRIFLLGQSFIPAINDVLLGYMLYQSRLVPRKLSVIGMAGALPLVAGYLAVMFGLIDQRSPLAGLSALMVAVFELSLGIYLIVKGFRTTTASQEN